MRVPHTGRDDVPFRDFERRLRALESVYVNPDTAFSAWWQMPHGIIAQQKLTTNSGAHTGTSDTDMLLDDMPVIAGRRYKTHLHSQYNWDSTATGIMVVTLKINTVTVDRFWAVDPYFTTTTPGNTTFWTIDSTLYYNAVSTTTIDLRVSVLEVSDGGSLTFNGGSDLPRTLTFEDAGAVP